MPYELFYVFISLCIYTELLGCMHCCIYSSLKQTYVLLREWLPEDRDTLMILDYTWHCVSYMHLYNYPYGKMNVIPHVWYSV